MCINCACVLIVDDVCIYILLLHDKDMQARTNTCTGQLVRKNKQKTELLMWCTMTVFFFNIDSFSLTTDLVRQLAQLTKIKSYTQSKGNYLKAACLICGYHIHMTYIYQCIRMYIVKGM